jgi:quercetin dioxygenase-like cupin family protein
MELKITPWHRETAPVEEELRASFEEQQLKVYRWTNAPEDVYHSHTHGYHKVLRVVKGTIRFDLPTRHETINLKAGDQLELPSGLRHSAVVGPEGVICLEAHVY